MKVSSNAIEVNKYFEHFVGRAYPDPGSPLGAALRRRGEWHDVVHGAAAIPAVLRKLSGAPWTVGYGDTGPEVGPDATITEPEALARMERRLNTEFGPAVLRLVDGRALSQGWFDGLTLWISNLGESKVKDSTMGRLLRAGDFASAGEQFIRWVSPGTDLELGLRRRRAAERALAFGHTAAEALARAKAVRWPA